MNKKKPVIDVLFTLTLFLSFTFSALAAVLLGAKVYESTQSRMDDHYTARTALAYVSEKIRQSDSRDAVQFTELFGIPALCLSSLVEGETYCTYLYYYDGSLRELFVEETRKFSLDQGSPIVELSAFSIEPLSQGFYQLSAVGSTEETFSALIRPKSS